MCGCGWVGAMYAPNDDSTCSINHLVWGDK